MATNPHPLTMAEYRVILSTDPPRKIAQDVCRYVHPTTMIVLMAGSGVPIDAQAMGIAILVEHMKTAAIALLRASTAQQSAQEIARSIAFMQGNELPGIVSVCNLGLDPDYLRYRFFQVCSNFTRWNHLHAQS